MYLETKGSMRAKYLKMMKGKRDRDACELNGEGDNNAYQQNNYEMNTEGQVVKSNNENICVDEEEKFQCVVEFKHGSNRTSIQSYKKSNKSLRKYEYEKDKPLHKAQGSWSRRKLGSLDDIELLDLNKKDDKLNQTHNLIAFDNYTKPTSLENSVKPTNSLLDSCNPIDFQSSSKDIFVQNNSTGYNSFQSLKSLVPNKTHSNSYQSASTAALHPDFHLIANTPNASMLALPPSLSTFHGSSTNSNLMKGSDSRSLTLKVSEKDEIRQSKSNNELR